MLSRALTTRPQRSRPLARLLLLGLLVLTGCGQKGALYLPTPATPAPDQDTATDAPHTESTPAAPAAEPPASEPVKDDRHAA